MRHLARALSAIVEGELSALPVVLAAAHSDLEHATSIAGRLTVSRQSVVRVLKAWRSGDFTAGEIQQWASFVRRGYVAQRQMTGIFPLKIEYDESDEGLIVEIIGRLDEIGDSIDGEIDDVELEALFISLDAK